MDSENSEGAVLNNLEIATELLVNAIFAFESENYITAIHLAGGVATVLPQSPNNLPVSFEKFIVQKEVLKAGGTETEEEISKRIHDLLWSPHNRLKHYDHPYEFKKKELRQIAKRDINWAGSIYLNNVDKSNANRMLVEKIVEFGKK